MSSFLTTIQEIEELRKKSTQGEWRLGHDYEWVGNNSEYVSDRHITTQHREVTGSEYEGCGILHHYDTRLICLLVNSAPQLLAMARWALTHGFEE